MRVNIYTLDKEDLAYLDKHIPETTVNNTGEKGYYTLGAVSCGEENTVLAGMAQFFVDSEKDGGSCAQLVHVYVADRYRRQSIGLSMIDTAGSILTKADVDVFKASISPESSDETGRNLTGDEIRSFLVECGFLPYGESRTELVRLTGRDYAGDAAATDGSDILKINDGRGAHIMFRMHESKADILGITLPDMSRNRAMATRLFRSAEAVLSSSGITEVSARFSDAYDGMGDYLSAMGLRITESSEIIAIDCNAFAGGDPAADKLRRQTVPGTIAMKLTYCDMRSLRMMMKFIKESGVTLSCYDLAHMDMEISFIVYDTKGAICSVLLGSVSDNNVYVEHLISLPGENDRRYTQVSIGNLIRNVLTPEGKPGYDQVIFAVSGPGTQAFADEIRETGLGPVSIRHSFVAKKAVSRHIDKANMPAASAIEKCREYEWSRLFSLREGVYPKRDEDPYLLR